MTHYVQDPIPGVDAAIAVAFAAQRKRWSLRALTTALGMVPAGPLNLGTVRYLARGGEAA